jgi:hypothetical protein
LSFQRRSNVRLAVSVICSRSRFDASLFLLCVRLISSPETLTDTPVVFIHLVHLTIACSSVVSRFFIAPILASQHCFLPKHTHSASGLFFFTCVAPDQSSSCTQYLHCTEALNCFFFFITPYDRLFQRLVTRFFFFMSSYALSSCAPHDFFSLLPALQYGTYTVLVPIALPLTAVPATHWLTASFVSDVLYIKSTSSSMVVLVSVPTANTPEIY